MEAFTCLMIFKNMFSFGLTWGAYDWLVNAGSLKTFYVIASIQIGVCLLSIPMCKSNRSNTPVATAILKGDLLQTYSGRRTERSSIGTTY